MYTVLVRMVDRLLIGKMCYTSMYLCLALAKNEGTVLERSEDGEWKRTINNFSTLIIKYNIVFSQNKFIYLQNKKKKIQFEMVNLYFSLKRL